MRTSFNEYYDLQETNGDNPERAARDAEKVRRSQDDSNLQYKCWQIAADLMDEILAPARNFVKRYGVPSAVVDMAFKDVDLIKKMGATFAEYAKKTGSQMEQPAGPPELESEPDIPALAL